MAMAARNPAVLGTKPRRGVRKSRPAPDSRRGPSSRAVPVKKAAAKARYRPAGVAMAVAFFGILASFIFGLVLLNIYVAQTSFQFDELQRQVAGQQDAYRQLRYELAVAESPGRLADAVAQLGLVAPDRQERLMGPPQATAGQHGSQEIAADANLKPLLVRKQ